MSGRGRTRSRQPRRFRWPWRDRATIRSEVDEEIAFHLDMRSRDLELEGLDPATARAQAVEEFGDVDQARRSLRAMDETTERGHRRRQWLDAFRWDLRLAARALRKSPGFTLVAIFTLALGIGGNVALFSVLEAVVLQDLPYPDADRLVVIWRDLSRRDVVEYPASPADLEDYRAADALAAVAGAGTGTATVTRPGDEPRPERVQIGWVTSGFFDVIRVRPTLGRSFGPADFAPPPADADAGKGPPTAVLLGHDHWRRRFGADPEVVGTSFRMDGADARVVGVMPPGFRLVAAPGAQVSEDVDLWMAARLDPTFRGGFFLYTIARLAPGASFADAQGQLEAVAARQRERFANYEAAGTRLRVEPMLDDLAHDARPRILALFGAVAFVLLIASANVANLLLVRASGRRRELSVRAALGADRWRLVRELLGESGLLALLGGAGGLGIAWPLLRILQASAPLELPRLADATIDGPVLGFTLLLTLSTALLFGTLPALAATRRGLFRGLRGRSGAGSAADGRLRHGLVVLEVGLSPVLLIGAGLMVRSLVALHRVDLGFEPRGVLAFELPIPVGEYPEPARRMALKRRIEERIAALPGVDAVGGGSGLPLDGRLGAAPFGSVTALADGDESDLRQANVRQVRAGYFGALGTRLLQGRTFTRRDEALGIERTADLVSARSSGEPAAGPADAIGPVIVDRTLADAAWPGESPLGKPLYVKVRVPGIWFEVVGVVEPLRQAALVDDRPTLYLPDGLTGSLSTVSWAVRVGSGSNPTDLVAPIRREVAALDPKIPLDRVRPLERTVAAALAPARFSLGLLGLFAAVALALSAVGLYGVLAFTVRRRTTEIGVRLAFGATRGQVLIRVVRHGLTLAVVGVALGTVAALGLTRFLGSFLVEVSPTDPLTFVTLALLLVLVSAAACLAPALRATRIDPSGLLREE